MNSDFLKIPSKRNVHNVPFTDIVHIRSRGAYTETYLMTGEKIISAKNLNRMCKYLENKNYFFRPHKSHVVNLTKIKHYRTSGRNGVVVMICGTMIPVSARKKAPFLKAYKSF